MTLPTLRDWLDSLNQQQLETMLERIPVATLGPRLHSLDDLAARLSQPHVVFQILQTAPSPMIQVVETVSALGGSAMTAAVTDLLAGPEADDRAAEQVAGWLAAANAAALLWRDGDRLRLNPAVDRVILGPFALARPVRALLPDLTIDVLRRPLRAAGIKAPNRKADVRSAVEAVFANPATLRRIAGKAPDEVLDRLNRHVLSRLHQARSAAETARLAGEVDERRPLERGEYAAEQAMRKWAIEHGLAFGDAWGYFANAEFPAEVYLALAPPGYRLPFRPEPPAHPTVPVPEEQLARTSAAATSQFVGTAMAILEAARSGLKTLKGGGIGARELTRFAKQVGTDVATVRLALYLGASLELVEQYDDGQIGTGAQFDEWRREPPAERAAGLITAWLALETSPTLDRGPDGTYLPAFGDVPSSDLPVALVICHLLGQHPGYGAVDAQQVLDQLAWVHPMADIAPGAGPKTWAEAHRLGVLADGALAPFADALRHAEIEQGIDLLTQMLPESGGQVLFGSDLTVVIPGSADPEAVDLLDALATREGHGVVGTWRVSEGSVRGALDSGYAVEQLLPALRELAGQDLPQALEYLIKDVARKHGHLGVRPAATVITADDEPLLAEVVASRSLRGLSLSLVAPTVAAAVKPPAEVLAGLRRAGYLPIEVDDGGAPVVQVRHLPGWPGGPAGDGLDGTPGPTADHPVPSSPAGAQIRAAGEADPDAGDLDDERAAMAAFLEAIRSSTPELADLLDATELEEITEPESPAELARRLFGE